MLYRRFETTYSCGDGYCGAEDCVKCRPNCNPMISTIRDLEELGYEFCRHSQAWYKLVSSTGHKARKKGAKHKLPPGTLYFKDTYRSIDDETGAAYLFSEYRVRQWPQKTE